MGSVMFHDRLERGRGMSQPVDRFGQIAGMIGTAENVVRALLRYSNAPDA